MKTLITTLALLILLAVGCSDQTGITAPEQSITVQEPNWLVNLPSNNNLLNKKHKASEVIEGYKGGEVKLKAEVNGGPFGKIKVESNLKAPKYSFTGTLTISTEVDDYNLLTSFGPSYVFDQPLEYTLILEGVDLSKVNPNNIDFVYQSPDGTIHSCQYKSISVDISKGKVKVDKAILRHFSRYGFVNRTE